MGKIGQGIQAGVGILVLASGVGAFYVWNHDPVLRQQLLEDVGAASKPAPQPPANAPIGFNAARTAFVLPHHLGYLPAPELALAKSDPAYAAGLTNLKDWIDLNGGEKGFPAYWLYAGSSSPTSAEAVVSYKYNTIGDLGVISSFFGGDQTASTSVPINDSTPHRIPTPSVVVPIYGQGYVSPSTIEIQAAPAGDYDGTLHSFCVPSPFAFLKGSHVDTPPQLSAITAGPVTIFTAEGSGAMYDHGAASCARFS